MLNVIFFFALNTLFSFLTCLLLFNERPGKTFIIYVPAILAAVTWDNLIIIILDSFPIYNEDSVIGMLLQQSTCHVLLILILSLLWLILKRLNLLYKLNRNKLSKTVYFLCISGFLMSSVIISVLRAASEKVGDSNLSLYYAVIIGFSILIQIICLSLIYLFYSREQYKTVNQVIEEYSGKQIEYYKALLAQEEDTRKFRHDIKNHILCIQELLDMGKPNEAKEYIQEIYQDLSKIACIYDTGNDIVNAIINYYAAKGKEDQIRLQVKGQLHPELSIPMLHMCTIVSNLLSNAYEATMKIDPSEDKVIHIELLSGSKYFKLIVRYPIAEYQKNLSDNPQSSKADQRSHGFGIRNVKAILTQYDGEFSLAEKDNSIIATVIMK
jgi:sensor histidine kinase YesM